MKLRDIHLTPNVHVARQSLLHANMNQLDIV